MVLRRPPAPALRPFVATLWLSDGDETPTGAARERVLPSGCMHVVLRLAGEPLRVFAGETDTEGRTLGHALVGGARSGYYVRDVSRPGPAVGAMLRPGAGPLLLGVPADELAERHTPLDALWGADAERERARLAEAATPEARLDRFEALLAARLLPGGLHPVVAHALGRFAAGASVGRVVEESGTSHRRFIALFRAGVGLPPKAWLRVMRFHAALERAAAGPIAWSELALDAGYADQSHFNRDFRAFAGITPGEFRALAPREAHHVPIPPPRLVRRG